MSMLIYIRKFISFTLVCFSIQESIYTMLIISASDILLISCSLNIHAFYQKLSVVWSFSMQILFYQYW